MVENGYIVMTVDEEAPGSVIEVAFMPNVNMFQGLDERNHAVRVCVQPETPKQSAKEKEVVK